MRQPNSFGVVKNDPYEDVPPEVPVGREIGSCGRGGSRTGRRSVEQTIHHTGPESTWFQQGLAPRRHEPVRAGSRRVRDGISRGFKIVEFEFRVRVRVSSNFLPLTSTKTVELPN